MSAEAEKPPNIECSSRADQPTVQPTATPIHTAIQEQIKIGTTIAFAKAYLDKQDTGLARQLSEEYAFIESVQNSGGKTAVKVTFVNVPKSPNSSFNYSYEQIFEDFVKATVPLFKTGDMDKSHVYVMQGDIELVVDKKIIKTINYIL